MVHCGAEKGGKAYERKEKRKERIGKVKPGPVTLPQDLFTDLLNDFPETRRDVVHFFLFSSSSSSSSSSFYSYCAIVVRSVLLRLIFDLNALRTGKAHPMLCSVPGHAGGYVPHSGASTQTQIQPYWLELHFNGCLGTTPNPPCGCRTAYPLSRICGARGTRELIISFRCCKKAIITAGPLFSALSLVVDSFLAVCLLVVKVEKLVDLLQKRSGARARALAHAHTRGLQMKRSLSLYAMVMCVVFRACSLRCTRKSGP